MKIRTTLTTVPTAVTVSVWTKVLDDMITGSYPYRMVNTHYVCVCVCVTQAGLVYVGLDVLGVQLKQLDLLL